VVFSSFGARLQRPRCAAPALFGLMSRPLQRICHVLLHGCSDDLGFGYSQSLRQLLQHGQQLGGSHEVLHDKWIAGIAFPRRHAVSPT